MASGFMAGVCFLAKQDYGVMNLCLGFLVILLTQCNQVGPFRKITFRFSALKDPEKIASIASAGIAFSILFAVPVMGLIYSVDSANFFYWFNYGQPPHELRRIHIWNFANHGNLFLPACIGFYLAYRTVRMDLLFSGIFFFCAFIVSSTSGLDYTAFFFFLFFPLLIQAVNDLQLVSNRWVSALLVLVAMSCVAFPAKYAYRLVQTTMLAKAEPFSFRHVYVTRPVQSYPQSMPYFKNVMGSDDSLVMIERLQEIAKANPDVALKVLNISELTPIYAELGSAPPLHYPLWYHSKISLFPKEIKMINQDIDDNKFDIILLQDAHGQANLDDFLGRLQNNHHYQTLRERGFVSPTTSTGDTCYEGYCPNHIYVYVKRSLLK